MQDSTTKEQQQKQRNESVPTEDQPIRKKVKRRPARKQVTLEQAAAVKKQPQQNGQTYNVWYNKWAGGDRYDSSTQKEKSKTRCKISTDAGYTRADGGNNAYCCLYFARGCCPYGSECSYLHRLPPPQSTLPDASLDVFGREKHSDYRDDMGGVGSFSRQNRTLYIGRLREINKNTEELVENHFQEWGEIERIRVLHGRGVAFVTYVSELSAQFAKEAMMCQSMVDDEVLNVRWATEDPNPAAKRSEHARIVKIGIDMIGSRLNPDLVEAVEALDKLEEETESKVIIKRNLNQDENNELEIQNKRLRHLSPQSELVSTTHLDQTSELTPNNNLISFEALQGLKNLASSTQAYKILLNNSLPKDTEIKSTPLLGLADYGSDTD